MKSPICSTLLLTLVSISGFAFSATVCDASIALPLSASNCNGDPTCLALQQSGADSAVCNIDNSCSPCDPSTDPNCTSSKKRALSVKRASGSFTCNSSSVCYTYNNILLCLDPATGNYVDENGGSGNAITGVYTAANGSVQTVAAGATATSGTHASTTHSSYAAATTTGSTVAAQTGASSSSSSSKTGAATRFAFSPRHVAGGLLGVAGFAYLFL